MADNLRRQRQTAEEAFIASLRQLRTVFDSDATLSTQTDHSEHSSPAKRTHSSSEASNDMEKTLDTAFESAVADIETFMQNPQKVVDPPSS